jgi:hypothetical protein
VSPFSSTCTLYDTPNNPGKSGDKGPAKNYRKKMRKKKIKVMVSGEESDAVLEGMKAIQSLKLGKVPAEPPNLDSAMLKGAKRPQADQTKAMKQEKKQMAAKQDPASILEAIAEGTKVMSSMVHVDPSKVTEQSEGEKVEHATGPALVDTLAEEAKTVEPEVTPQDQVEKKQVLVEKQAPTSILEAIAKGTKMMESLLDQSKATMEQRTERRDDDTLDALTEGYKMIESLVASEDQAGTSSMTGRPRTRNVMGARKEQGGVDDFQ